MSAKNTKKISIFTKISIILIQIYQKTLSGYIGKECRFHPTCSDYAIIAIKRFGFFKGWFLAFKRIGKCNPWGPHGFDYVPENKKEEKNCD